MCCYDFGEKRKVNFELVFRPGAANRKNGCLGTGLAIEAVIQKYAAGNYSDFQNYIPLQSVGVYRNALWAGLKPAPTQLVIKFIRNIFMTTALNVFRSISGESISKY